MPLEKIMKISLTHKETIRDCKCTPDTYHQGVPQSTCLCRKWRIFHLCRKGRIYRLYLKRKAPASLTVEAALVFPLCLFVLVGILFLFRVMQLNKVTAEALAETGSWLSSEAGVEETEEQEGILLAQAVGYFHKELLARECPTKYILGDRFGISWEQTELEGEYVDLQIRYLCRLPVSLPGISAIPIAQRVRMKKWTGYHGENDSSQEEDRWVYITPNGEVYHLHTSCTHLRLAVETMGKEKVKEAGYTPCLLCGTKQSLYSYYYVTKDGQRYHTRLDCSGLKRTVSMIRLSQVGSRSCCSRCGGE